MQKVKNTVHSARRARVPVEGLFCQFPQRQCMQNRLDGQDYCIRHILEDKAANFKQCAYTSTQSGKRCHNAIQRSDKKESYCIWHSRKAALIRHKATKRRRPRTTPETLLDDLEHHTPRDTSDPNSRRARPSLESVASRLLELTPAKDTRAMDYGSSSDSENEQTLVSETWHGDVDSDAESIDSEGEDPLKHAGVYTAEEVALITRDKLIRLQSLYIDQFKRLQHVMRENRRTYLSQAKIERETMGSIHAAKNDPEQHEKYEKLVAMKRYHKRFGQEALLHRKSRERRIQVSEGGLHRTATSARCQHQETGSQRCSARAMPASRLCFNHILNDPYQVLFKACNYGDECAEPVTKLEKASRCRLHLTRHQLARRYPLPVAQQQSVSEDVDIETVPQAASGVESSTTPAPLQSCDVTQAVSAAASADTKPTKEFIASQIVLPMTSSLASTPPPITVKTEPPEATTTPPGGTPSAPMEQQVVTSQAVELVGGVPKSSPL